jgi:putative DNA primase/helicase
MADDNIVRLADMNDTPPALTEDSAALEFARRYEDELRFDHEIGKWFRWTGKYWECERTQLAFHWSRELVRELADASANKSKQTSKIAFAGAVERAARADPCFAVTSKIWDADLWLLNTQGGTIDLRTSRMRRHGSNSWTASLAAMGTSSIICSAFAAIALPARRKNTQCSSCTVPALTASRRS